MAVDERDLRLAELAYQLALRTLTETVAHLLTQRAVLIEQAMAAKLDICGDVSPPCLLDGALLSGQRRDGHAWYRVAVLALLAEFASGRRR
jgi:hypothetical protein